MTNEHEIRKAGADSWYNRSGFREGADPKVLEDLGFESPERTEEIVRSLGADAIRGNSVTRSAPDIGEQTQGFAETDDGRVPDYFEPFDENRLPSAEHIRLAEEYLPGIKEKLGQLRDRKDN